ncbi:hypothetical protein ACP275_08G153700 [Erythranthe tilingii]
MHAFLFLACVIINQQQYLKTYGNLRRRSHYERRRSFSLESPLSLLSFHLKKRQRSNNLGDWWWLLVHCTSYRCTPQQIDRSRTSSSLMGTKMKGIYKGFKYTLSQIFVVKDREMEIGGPTDVKHVAHIGWEGPSGSAPTWMNEFRAGQDFAATSIGNSGSALSPWSSQDFGDQSMRQQSESEMPSTEHPRTKKKEKIKKPKSSSSPKSGASYSSRSSRNGKSKSKFIEEDSKPSNIKVS